MRDKISLFTLITSFFFSGSFVNSEKAPATFAIRSIWSSIEDNGNGIPEDKLEKIFEPNFTTKSSGTGLGLAMVKRMIEDYKGEISIRSKEGKGTTLMIILPTNM